MKYLPSIKSSSCISLKKTLIPMEKDKMEKFNKFIRNFGAKKILNQKFNNQNEISKYFSKKSKEWLLRRPNFILDGCNKEETRIPEYFPVLDSSHYDHGNNKMLLNKFINSSPEKEEGILKNQYFPLSYFKQGKSNKNISKERLSKLSTINIYSNRQLLNIFNRRRSIKKTSDEITQMNKYDRNSELFDFKSFSSKNYLYRKYKK